MDIFAALALATEPPLKSVIDGPPFTDNVSLLSPTVWRQILGVSFYNVLILCLVMFFGRMAANLDEYDRDTTTLMSMPDGFDVRMGSFLKAGVDNIGILTPSDLEYQKSQAKARHFTYIFEIFVFLQLFNMINCRKIGKRDFNVFESMFHNWYFIFFFCLIGGVQFAGTQYFSLIFRTVPLSRTEWGSCIVVGSTNLLWAALLKVLPERWFKRLEGAKLIDEDAKTESAIVKTINEQKKKMNAPPVESGDEPDMGGDDGDDKFEAI
jgi:magnesium-transporting ATPase (P-type)